MLTLDYRRTPRPRIGGPLERFIHRAKLDAVAGRWGLCARSERFLEEYQRIADRFSTRALVRHHDRVYLALQNGLDSYGPEI